MSFIKTDPEIQLQLRILRNAVGAINDRIFELTGFPRGAADEEHIVNTLRDVLAEKRPPRMRVAK